jgi:hypothetical protein
MELHPPTLEQHLVTYKLSSLESSKTQTLLESTVDSFADQPALLPINRRLFCRSTVGDEHLREDHEAMELESWFSL